MEPGTRVPGPSGVVVKNRGSSGCLIVRKKGDDGLGGVVVGGSSGSRKQSGSKKVRKRPKVVMSDSESSDEQLLMPPARKLGPETIRVCNGLTAIERGMVGTGTDSGEVSRKRERVEETRRNGDGVVEENGLERRGKKQRTLEVFDFDEYDGMDVELMRRRRFDNNGVGLGGGRPMGTVHAARGSVDREFETGSSRHIVEKRKKSYHDRASGSYLGDSVDHSKLKKSRDRAQRPLPSLREKFTSDEPIRVQGKNGVLKVMVNKKKAGEPLLHYDRRKPTDSRQSLRAEGTSKRNDLIRPSSHVETKPAKKQGFLVRPEKKQIATRKLLPSKDRKVDEQDSDNSDASLNLGVKNIKACKSSKKITSDNVLTPKQEKLQLQKLKKEKSGAAAAQKSRNCENRYGRCS